MLEMKSQIYIIDDDLSVREALEALLSDAGYEIHTFQSAEGLLESLDNPHLHCMILDVHLPGLDGLRLQQQLKSNHCSVPIIFITGFGDIPMSVKAIKAGAVDFLTKPFSNDTVLAAVHSAIEFSRRYQTYVSKMNELRSRYSHLTPRERTVFPLIVAGLANKNVGFELGISEITVKAHRCNLMRKMNADSLASLIKMAIKLEIPINRKRSYAAVIKASMANSSRRQVKT